MRTPTVLLLTALLLAAPVSAQAAEGDPAITASDTTIELAAGERVFVAIGPLTSGTSPGLYSENIAVTAGPCITSFGWSGGRPGVDVELPTLDPSECTIAYRPHDTTTGIAAAEPGTITVTLPAPPTSTPTTSDATPTATSPDALAPEDTDRQAAVPPATPSQGVPGWQQTLALAAAALTLMIGSAISLTHRRHRHTFEQEDR